MVKIRRRKNVLNKFAKDEDGAVMVMTVVLMFLLVKAAFSTFNVGLLVAERTRLQVTTDTAAYASAVWQARFLNFCAYTRRAVIASYANVALISGTEANYQNVKYYYDKKPFCITGCYFTGKINPDNAPGMPRISVMILYPLYTAVKTALVDGEGRECAEALAKIHSTTQQVLYYYTAMPWFTVVPNIVDEANKATGNGTVSKIEVSPSYAAWGSASFVANRKGMLNKSMLRDMPLGELQDDVEARFDTFTDPSNLPFSISFDSGGQPPISVALPFFACRPYWTFDLAWIADLASCTVINICCIPPSKAWVMGFYTFNNPQDFSFDDKKAYTDDKWMAGLYYGGKVGTDILFGIPICAPCTMPVFHFETFEGHYDMTYGSDSFTLYDMKEDVPADQREPSVYVALRIQREEYVNDQGTGKLIHNQGMQIGNQTRDMVAIARAKVFFQPRYSGEDAFAPNLYHPYWEAELAPVFGYGYDNTTDTIKENGQLLLAAMVIGQEIDSPIPPNNSVSTLLNPIAGNALAKDIHY